MVEIKDIETLRKHAIETIKRLQMRSIELEEAATTSKLYENIISTIKSELEYNKFMNVKKEIPFIGGLNSVVSVSLTSSKSKMIDEANVMLKLEKKDE